MNNLLTSEMPRRNSNNSFLNQLEEKVNREIRAIYIKNNGIDAYLESYSNYLKEQACLSDAERFDLYYKTREEAKQLNHTIQ